MFPINSVKREVSDENNEINGPNSKEIKIEVKMEEVDPLAGPSFDNNLLNTDNVKIEPEEVDFEAIYVKDEFDSEVVKQELENNDEAINRPVVLGSSEAALKQSGRKLVVLPKKVYMDLKSKTKTEGKECQCSHLQTESESRLLMHRNAELSNEMGMIKSRNTRNRKIIQTLKHKVSVLENRAKASDAKMKEANLMSVYLQGKIDKLETHICLLSRNNSKLEAEVNSLRGRRRIRPTIKTDVESNKIETLTGNSEPSVKVLKETIVSLVKEKNIIMEQLDKKTAELKKTQEKYGNTIIALSRERRKTDELMKNVDPNKETKKSQPFVWTIRK